jgi:addiction module HigA family antidote
MPREVPYPHPGEILLEEFLKPMGITSSQLAKEIGVAQPRLNGIIQGLRPITIDLGLRLSRFFSMSDSFWIGLQTDYDIVQARDKLVEVLNQIKPYRPDSLATVLFIIIFL